MFDDNYIVESKGLPLVSYHKKLKSINPPWIFTHTHYHSDFELLYIVKGKAKMQIDGDIVKAQSGSLILINPYEVHYGEILSEAFEYYCIDFNLSLLSLPYEAEILAEEKKFESLVANHNLKTYIESIYLAYANESPGWKLCAKGNLLILFSHLEPLLIASIPSKRKDFSKSVINYIDENYSKNITSKSASEALRYDQSYFCRTFKKLFGLKFNEYLSIYRVKIAKELLKSESVSTAASMSGFSSISYFSVIFKKITGITPMQYRTEKL